MSGSESKIDHPYNLFESPLRERMANMDWEIDKQRFHLILKEKCIAIRLQLIIGFNQLRAILASIKEEPTEELKRELTKWLRYMNDLHIHSISILNPGSVVKDKAGSTLDQIREYQGIDRVQLEEAINQLK